MVETALSTRQDAAEWTLYWDAVASRDEKGYFWKHNGTGVVLWSLPPADVPKQLTWVRRKKRALLMQVDMAPVQEAE